ncbi:uncharacterized protein isoform X12 [Leptinotarsa decemlineata]|uniref:uncharacterized protein isoform X12 n=1 Tax=Leptinotarsa decemlineata TaxID=7539 RepID=UPI003D305825
MVFCAAYQCKSSSNKKEPDITFHRFPANPVKKNLWVQAVKLENWTPSPNDRLCSKHFEKRFFYQTDFKRCLLHSAVPTIFPELPNYMQPKKTVKRKALHLEAVPGTSGSHGTQAPIVDEILLRQQVEWDGKKYYGRPDDGAEIKSEPDDQILQPVPECSSRNPEEYLPENPPIANHAKDVAKQSIPKRHFGKVVCRMCLESAAKTQMVPLTTWDVNYAGRSEAYKQNKILQTERVNSMINVVMPNFDFDIAYNPMICHKCVARLESAFNFIEECKESEKVIHSYKTKFASHQELVSCDDVAQNRRLLEKEESRRKRRKSSKQHDNDRLVTSSPLGQNESISAGDTSQVEVHEFERVDCGESQESITMETNSEIMTSIKSEREDLECDDSEGNSFLINTADLTSVIVKEEVSVKEEVPCDFNDLPTNDQHCDLIVKDEAYSLTIAYGTDENDEYHRDSALSRKRKEMDPGT